MMEGQSCPSPLPSLASAPPHCPLVAPHHCHSCCCCHPLMFSLLLLALSQLSSLGLGVVVSPVVSGSSIHSSRHCILEVE